MIKQYFFVKSSWKNKNGIECFDLYKSLGPDHGYYIDFKEKFHISSTQLIVSLKIGTHVLFDSGHIIYHNNWLTKLQKFVVVGYINHEYYKNDFGRDTVIMTKSTINRHTMSNLYYCFVSELYPHDKMIHKIIKVGDQVFLQEDNYVPTNSPFFLKKMQFTNYF